MISSPKIGRKSASVATIADHGEAMTNQNANHSQESTSSRRRGQIKSVVTIPDKAHGASADTHRHKVIKESSNLGKPEQSISRSPAVAEFNERGDHVSMEIDDGGLAAQEFASDRESAPDSETSDAQSEPESDDSNPSEGECDRTSQSENDTDESINDHGGRRKPGTCFFR